VDPCIKIRQRGRKVFYTPEVRVIHHFGPRWERDLASSRWTPRRIRRSLVRRVGMRLPHRLGRAIEHRLDMDFLGYFTREQCARLRHHHRYWRTKWGWDARNPDMSAVERRWGGTEICWATDPDRRAAGERIVEAYYARRDERAVRTA
jgi:hypothetical protein